MMKLEEADGSALPQGSDRLEEIRLALRVAQSQGGAISVDFTCKAKDRMAWLIGEVERLRAGPPGEPPGEGVVEAVAIAMWDARFEPGNWRWGPSPGSRDAEREQARVAIAAYRTAVTAGASGGAATNINQTTGHPMSCRCEKCEEFDRRAIEHAKRIVADAEHGT